MLNSGTPSFCGPLQGFPRHQGAGRDARKWDTSSWHQGRSLFTPNMVVFTPFSLACISVHFLVRPPQPERPRDGSPNSIGARSTTRCVRLPIFIFCRAATRGMKGVDPEVDAALAPPQLASLAHADQAASRSEARSVAGGDGSSSGGGRIRLPGVS